MAEKIGIMDKTYFTPKNVILNWINECLKLNCKKVEEFGNGIIYCKLFNHYFPNNLLIKRVNLNAKHEFDFCSNFKILQKWFDDLNIKKYIEVNKLVKKKLLDNLEFIQWMKKYFENMNVKPSTDPVIKLKTKIRSSKNSSLEEINNSKLDLQKIKDIMMSNKEDKIKLATINSILKLSCDIEECLDDTNIEFKENLYISKEKSLFEITNNDKKYIKSNPVYNNNNDINLEKISFVNNYTKSELKYDNIEKNQTCLNN